MNGQSKITTHPVPCPLCAGMTRIRCTDCTCAHPSAVYAEKVTGVLVTCFPDLLDPIILEIIRPAVRRQAENPARWFEVIVDDPRQANWRLRPHRTEPGRVRLACFRMTMRDEDVTLERTVNEALAVL